MNDLEPLWRAAEETRGRPIGANTRAFLVAYLKESFEQILGCPDAEAQRVWAARIARMVDEMETAVLADREGGAQVLVSDDPGAKGSGVSDRRWRLWSELRAALATGERSEDWRVLRLTRVLDHSASLLPSSRVEISFDSRLSLSRLKAALVELWPAMLEEGWVRQSRPMQRRAEGLVRFVCLECSPALTWEQRWKAWQQGCRSGGPRSREWRYADHRAMHSDFRRAEKALTGRPRGLAVFYDARLREALRDLHGASRAEIERRAQAGDPLARTVLDDVRRPSLDAIAPLHRDLYRTMLRELARRAQAGEISQDQFLAVNPRGAWDKLMEMDVESEGDDALGGWRVERDPHYDGGLFTASMDELFEGFFRHAGIRLASPDAGRGGAET